MGKDKKRLVIIGASALACLLVLTGGYFFLSQEKEEDNVPPILKEMLRLNEDVKKTTIEIYNASGKLDSISMVQSRITDIKTTIGLIQNMRELVKENQDAIDRLILFAEEHETYFYRKNLDWIFAVRDFYTDRNVIHHHESRSNYLKAFEKLLTYTYENFQNIMELQSKQHMMTYDAYYHLYRTAADSHNRFNRKRISFQKEFVNKYPEVSPFLPGGHHTESFKFWDKFSF